MPEPEQLNSEVDWILRDRNVIGGLDHLGIEVVSVNLYQALLPGITNVTDRARYYAFYPWCIHAYAQSGPSERTKQNWYDWIRTLDFAYALASVAYDRDEASQGASAIVGLDRAVELLKNKFASERIDIRGSTLAEHRGRPGSYFQNTQGGFGQYYRGPLRELGVVHDHDEAVWPDVRLTNHAGRQLAEALDLQSGFAQLAEAAREGSATVSELVAMGSAVHPRSIDPGREQSLLRGLLLGTDDELCQTQRPEQRHWRRTSLRLMLDFLGQTGGLKSRPDAEFRWACAADALPSGAAWTTTPDLAVARACWGTYQRNDILNFAIESLFWAALVNLDESSWVPLGLARHMAEAAVASVTTPEAIVPPLGDSVSEWMRQCERPAAERTDDPWGDSSTRRLVDLLVAARKKSDWVGVCGLAARVLGRLFSDRGGVGENPFASIPGATEMASSREIHLQRWWSRVQQGHDQGTREFLAELSLEWIIYRHLRVATRKLANQGVSTFKLRPEEGKLVLAADEIVSPTFTTPRLRQGFSVLADLGLAASDQSGWTVSADGARQAAGEPSA